MGRISISQAATQFGVSRRTLERWIRDGRLTAVPNEKDARQRLVDPETVQFLIRQMPRRRRNHKASAAGDEVALGAEHAAVDVRDRLAIDKALLQAYRMHRLLVSRLAANPDEELPLEELRNGPLGRDLQHLAAYAQGLVFEDSRLVRSAIDSVLQILFWPTAADDYTVPRTFWDTDLGKLLSRAKLRAYTPGELISIDEAAQILGVTAPTIYRWMDDRTLGWVRDDLNGRTWVMRRDIDQLKRKAAELAVRPMMPERALAS
jgi:excisionase family DNA binding protein